MHDLKAKHEHLLQQAIDCDLISRLATDIQKRALFRKLAADLRGMAKEIEATIASRAAEAPAEAHAPPSRGGMGGSNGNDQNSGL